MLDVANILYPPHMRRLPVKADLPCSARQLSKTTTQVMSVSNQPTDQVEFHEQTRTQHSAGLELEPVLIFLIADERVEFSGTCWSALDNVHFRCWTRYSRGSVIPLLHLGTKRQIDTRPICCVPPYLHEVAMPGRMIQDWEGVHGLYADALITACVGEESGLAEDFIRLPILCIEASGHTKAIYEG